MTDTPVYEDQHATLEQDPDQLAIRQTRLFTQPYDLVITSLISQIRDGTVYIRQLSARPHFQRRYVWPNRLASRLVESILLNVPIPPCYLAQDHDYTLDVIDGQQRIFSIYRFLDNQFTLRELEVLTTLNGKAFHELDATLRRKLETYSLRCIIITNDSDPEIRFEVFERLNTNTMPLNAQELRNSISRGPLINLLGKLATQKKWLNILNRDKPDNRMRGEELILRFFAFYLHGLESYRTPQKRWLNDAATKGRGYSDAEISRLHQVWENTLYKCLLVFKPLECFRRLPLTERPVVNRALMDLTMSSLVNVSEDTVKQNAEEFYRRYLSILTTEEFHDLITRSVDHKSRTLRRFELWSEIVMPDLF